MRQKNTNIVYWDNHRNNRFLGYHHLLQHFLSSTELKKIIYVKFLQITQRSLGGFIHIVVLMPLEIVEDHMLSMPSSSLYLAFRVPISAIFTG